MGKASKKQRILNLVLQSEIELTPKEISRRTNINHSTVRNYLRQLLRENQIVQPYIGSYCSQITHGMIMAPLRTHNVILTAGAPWLNFSDDKTEFVGGVKVRVQFGLQRRKVTGRISCDEGMDKNSVSFALNHFFDIVKRRTGKDLDEVVVKTFEINRDVVGVRLDGAKCYTRKGLFGMVERVYQRDDTVRSEVKVTRKMSPDQFQALLQGGVTGYNTQQAIFFLSQKIEALAEAQKFTNELMVKILMKLS